LCFAFGKVNPFKDSGITLFIFRIPGFRRITKPQYDVAVLPELVTKTCKIYSLDFQYESFQFEHFQELETFYTRYLCGFYSDLLKRRCDIRRTRIKTCTTKENDDFVLPVIKMLEQFKITCRFHQRKEIKNKYYHYKRWNQVVNIQKPLHMVGASLYTLKTIFSQINIWADSLG
jgi:hypothetical protein